MQKIGPFWPSLILVISLVYVSASGCLKGPPPTEAQIMKGAADFCKFRAGYKVLAALANGKLDPEPGSPRATLEANEDKFCASFAAITADAGIP